MNTIFLILGIALLFGLICAIIGIFALFIRLIVWVIGLVFGIIDAVFGTFVKLTINLLTLPFRILAWIF